MRHRARRDVGELAVGAAVSGVLGYVFFSIVTRTLGAADAAPVSVLWTYWGAAAAVLSFPLQHWIARSIEAHASEGHVRSAIPRIIAVVAGLSFAVSLTGWLLRDMLFHRPGLLFPALLAAVTVGSAFLGMVRGGLTARRQFRAVAMALVAENVMRCVGALALAVAGVRNPAAYGIVMAAGPLVGLAWPRSFRFVSGEVVVVGDSPLAFLGGVAGGTLVSQVILTGGPVALALLGGAPADITSLFATLALFRAPYTLALGLVSMVTGRLTAMVVAGRSRDVGRLVVIVAASALIGAVVGGPLGSLIAAPLTRAVFGAGVDLPRQVSGFVVAGNVLALANLVVTLALVARDRSAAVLRSWLAAAVSAVVVLVVVDGPLTAVAAAFVTAEFVALAMMAADHLLLGRAGAAQPTQPAAQRRVRDPVVWLVGLIALIVYALHGFDGVLSRDLGVYAYGAQGVIDGLPPYVGILNRAGPLAHLIPAIGVAIARLLSMDDLFAMRLTYMAISAGCVCVVYALGRRILGSRWAGLVAAAVFLSFYGFIEMATYGPREKTPMVLFMALMLLAIAHRGWFAAGVCASLAVLTWQPAALPAAIALAVPLLGLHGPSRRRAFTLLFGGGVLPLVVTAAYFASMGALAEFADGFLLLNYRYTPATPFAETALQGWRSLQRGYGVTLWLMLVGIAALVTATVARVRGLGWTGAMNTPLVVTGCAGVAAVLWTLYDIDGWPDAFIVLPFAAIGVAWALDAIGARGTSSQRGAVLALFLVAELALATTYSVSRRDTDLVAQRASVAHIIGQLPPDATILSLQAPQALVLSGRTNPFRHQMISGGLDSYIDDTWPGGFHGFVQAIGRERPSAIVWGGLFRGGLRDDAWDAALRELLRTEYQRVDATPGWVWYVRTPLSGDVVPLPRAADS